MDSIDKPFSSKRLLIVVLEALLMFGLSINSGHNFHSLIDKKLCLRAVSAKSWASSGSVILFLPSDLLTVMNNSSLSSIWAHKSNVGLVIPEKNKFQNVHGYFIEFTTSTNYPAFDFS